MLCETRVLKFGNFENWIFDDFHVFSGFRFQTLSGLGNCEVCHSQMSMTSFLNVYFCQNIFCWVLVIHICFFSENSKRPKFSYWVFFFHCHYNNDCTIHRSVLPSIYDHLTSWPVWSLTAPCFSVAKLSRWTQCIVTHNSSLAKFTWVHCIDVVIKWDGIHAAYLHASLHIIPVWKGSHEFAL